METGYVGLERSLMVKVKTLNRLIKEHAEAKKKMKVVDQSKQTFLKIQIPKMEKQIKELKVEVRSLLKEDEIAPNGEYYLLGKKLIK